MHGHSAPSLPIDNLVAARIAALSEEYLGAPPARRLVIGEEIAGLISGRIVPLAARQ